MQAGCRKSLLVRLRRRSLSAGGYNYHQRGHYECGAAHAGECGQSRASPVYVDPLRPPSAFADSDSSDNWTFQVHVWILATREISCLSSAGALPLQVALSV